MKNVAIIIVGGLIVLAELLLVLVIVSIVGIFKGSVWAVKKLAKLVWK